MNNMDLFSSDKNIFKNREESEIFKIKKKYAEAFRKILEGESQLPSKRESLAYNYWRSGKTYSDIALLMNIKAETAKQLKYRYEKKLIQTSLLISKINK